MRLPSGPFLLHFFADFAIGGFALADAAAVADGFGVDLFSVSGGLSALVSRIGFGFAAIGSTSGFGGEGSIVGHVGRLIHSTREPSKN